MAMPDSTNDVPSPPPPPPVAPSGSAPKNEAAPGFVVLPETNDIVHIYKYPASCRKVCVGLCNV